MTGNRDARGIVPSRVLRVLVWLALLLVVAACGDDPTDEAGVTVTGQPPSPDDGAEETDMQAGASCVTEYSAETLTERAFAFDGTVVEVRPETDPRGPVDDVVTGRAVFEVHEWFSGGSGDTVEVWPQREVTAGQRLLVAGEPRWGGEPLEDAIAWECGFTSAYSEELAADWADAFAVRAAEGDGPGDSAAASVGTEVPLPCRSARNVERCIQDFTEDAEARPLDLTDEFWEEVERAELETQRCLETQRLWSERSQAEGSGIVLTCGTVTEDDRILVERGSIDVARSRSLAEGVEASVRAWLTGPSPDELEVGLRTPLSDSAELLTNVAVEGSTAIVSFDEAGLQSASTSWGLPGWDHRFIGELAWNVELHPELEHLMVMVGDRCFQEFSVRAECQAIELRLLDD